MRNKMLSVGIVYLALYIILFLIIPFLCSYTGFPLLGNEGVLVLALVTIFITSVGMIFIDNRLYIWCAWLLFYIILIFIYHPQEGQYNIGTWGLFGNSYISQDIAWLGIIVVTIQTLFWEFVVWSFIKIIKKLIYKNKSRKLQ